jgi:asparagine synthetase B (glutamine-hydrolysing)
VNEIELLEYGIYHNILGGGGKCIPGIKSNGLIDIQYFENTISNSNKIDTVAEIESWLCNSLPKWRESLKHTPLMLCSGGVDSSTLAAMLGDQDAYLLHTSYVQHDNNDLQKLCKLLDHFPLRVEINSISEGEYLAGLLSLIEGGILQNTYGPSIEYALSHKGYGKNYKHLITGSAPDELFYGMEKYSFDYFKKLDNIPVEIALEKIDVNYNFIAFNSILNSNGKDVVELIKNKREKLYNEISSLYDSIYDAQRLLAYSTVTTQHMKMYDDISNKHNLKHIAPFMDKNLVELSFGTPVMSLVDVSLGTKNVEIGKKHLKKILENYMPKTHVYSKKIGFHAPVTKYLYSGLYRKYFDEMLDSTPLKGVFNEGKFRNLVTSRLNSNNEKEIYSDYFLYAVLNIFLYEKNNDNK